MKTFVCLALLVAVAFADEKGNTRADDFLNTIKTKYGDRIDPYRIEDMGFKIDNIGPIAYHGRANMTNARLTGLKSLHRVGEASTKTGNGYDYLEFSNQADNLKLNVDFELVFPPLQTIKYSVEVAVAKVVTKKEFLFVNNHPRLTNFHVTELEGIEIHHHGGPLDELADAVVKAFVEKNGALIQRVTSSAAGYLVEQFYLDL